MAVVLLAMIGGVLLVQRGRDAEATDRSRAVAARGATVMPFDQDATTHVFAKTDDGGVQTVTADRPDDTAQRDLIRSHLRQETTAFAAGDFRDPLAIHGPDMPGVAALVAGHERVTVAYRDVENGGRITYTTADPQLVQAIHTWFDAQLADHAGHAHG